MNYKSIVNIMRSNNDILNKCINETNVLYKCILCRNGLSSNQWSSVLESYIKNKFHISPKINNTSGDGVSYTGKNIEIKVSLGSNNGQINFVQLRPDHNIDYYLFLVYNLFEDDLGKIYWFLIEPKDLYKLIPKYGGYAHGTVTTNGKITLSNLYNRNMEYCLRPNPTKLNTFKCRELWDKLLKYQKTEEQIMNILNNSY